MWIRVALLGLVLAACGDNIKLGSDGGTDGPTGGGRCGNGAVEGTEECDDGDVVTDVSCDSTCRLTCGNGTVDDGVGETCDTGLSGSCPATCDDADTCTSDVLSGADCTAECLYTDITAPIDGDGCCPAGANETNDDDCAAVCGNGVLETGERCDITIPAGMAGACPTACMDGQVCTIDRLVMGGTCQARCRFIDITMPIDDDGCCPPGADATTDNDCSANCGNGVVEAGETCDTAITTGPGRCPTSCNDGMACTTNVLLNPGTCIAACDFPPIVNPQNGDGCCPPGANANNDNDCPPVCGNGVPEPGEQCDDGNTNNTDACSNSCMTNVVITAFRFTSLVLKDPHVFASFVFCIDVTNSNISGFSVNEELATNVTMDGDGDGLYDLSPTAVFRPLNQANNATTPLDLHFADCMVSPAGCTPSTTAPILLTATSQTAGTCLQPLAGTLRPYSPAVTNSTAPCFSSNMATVTIDLGGIPITLRDARVGATYNTNPATNLVNGLLMGFISEADANATIIPDSFPVVGGDPLSSLLPGGMGACPGHDDRDMNGTVRGWWFYLNFTATTVPWTP